jgi:hypothetical protein
MSHSTLLPSTLQSILFSRDDFSQNFFRSPSERELEFMFYFHIAQTLLSSEERIQLTRFHSVGRKGYNLFPIFGILMLKLMYHERTMKETLQHVEENMNLRDILGLPQVPSEASMSRLSRKIEAIVSISAMHERLIGVYDEGMGRIIGHLSMDSTTIEAREKPFKKEKAPPEPPKKRGRKAKGSVEEKEYLERLAREEEARLQYLAATPEKLIAELEMRCSITAKKNSKGKIQYFIGYKAHIATDDFGVPISFVVTGACVHDSKVAVPLLKAVYDLTDYFYILLDKGYICPAVNDYADMIERPVIIDRKTYKGKDPIPLEPAAAQRYKARTIVERTNSELKDGYLPDKIYKRGSQARFEIELSILLTTIKKVRNMLLVKEEQEKAAS